MQALCPVYNSTGFLCKSPVLLSEVFSDTHFRSASWTCYTEDLKVSNMKGRPHTGLLVVVWQVEAFCSLWKCWYCLISNPLRCHLHHSNGQIIGKKTHHMALPGHPCARAFSTLMSETIGNWNSLAIFRPWAEHQSRSSVSWPTLCPKTESVRC